MKSRKMNINRIAAMLLAAALILGIFPAQVFADDAEEAVDARIADVQVSDIEAPAEADAAEAADAPEAAETARAAEVDDAQAVETTEAVDAQAVETTEAADAAEIADATEITETAEIADATFPADTAADTTSPADTIIWANDDIYLTGSIPQGATVEVIPVDYEIDGRTVIAAYDINIYETEEAKAAGQTWQPAGDTVKVHIKSEALADTEGSVDVFHVPAEAAEPEFVATVEATSSAVEFDAAGFSVYVIVQAEDNSVPPTAFAGTVAELDGKNILISNKRSSTEYYLLAASRDASWMAQSPAQGSAQAFLFTLITKGKNAGCFTVSFEDGGTTRYLTLNTTSLFTSETPSFFKITKNNGFFLMQMANGSDNYVNHNDASGFTRWKDGYRDAGNRLIFTVAAENEADPFGLNGKSFGLMVHNNDLFGIGMQSSTAKNAGRLSGLQLAVRQDPINRANEVLMAKGQTLAFWTFSCICGQNYHITTEVEGAVKYLNIEGANVYLSGEPGTWSSLFVSMDSKAHAGKIRITNKDGQAINLYGGNIDNGFGGFSDNSANEWLTLVDLSVLSDEDFVLYAAGKVSVSDTENVKNGSKVVIYTRVWNDTEKQYEFYAIDQNGYLVRAYETGDNIRWIGSRINTLLWEFTEYYNEGTTTPNYYYELRNTYSGKYIAPQLGSEQVLSDSTIGINLNGRRYGDYYSTVMAWDDHEYTYAALKADAAKAASASMGQAGDFYFALMDEPTAEELTLVETIDHSAFGLSMKLVDYEAKTGGAGASADQTAVMGVKNYTKGNVQSGLLSTGLDANGYPTVIGTGRSLGDLYRNAAEVNHLFVKSTYEVSGYYEFDSTQNFASICEDGNFKVYKEIGSVNNYSDNYIKHGQFMPFNDLKQGLLSNHQNLFDALIRELSDDDPRKGESLYLIEDPNYYFGVEITANFVQTPSGYDEWGHDIIFEFTGDDDFWLYVDGELIIDLGGIHDALPGSVNYSTGEVKMAGPNGKMINTTIYDLFKAHYQERGLKESVISAKLAETFDEKDGRHIFKEYSIHEMKIFFMERGAGASNLHMRFNLASVKPGQVELSKSISGTDSRDYRLAEFPFQVWYSVDDNAAENREYRLLSGQDNGKETVSYKRSGMPVTYKSSYSPAGSAATFENVFMLRPGEVAEIKFPENTVDYFVTECGVNTGIYDSVSANGTVLAGAAAAGDGRFASFSAAPAEVSKRPQIKFDNHVSESALRTLTVEKKLFGEGYDRALSSDANEAHLLSYSQDPTGFDFRLYLAAEGAELAAANVYPYSVIDAEGNFCEWNSAIGSFVKIGGGISSFSALTAEQKEAATFHTSPNGAISRIPNGFSIVVRGLLVGTSFMIEEREYEIPDGYSLIGYERVDGTYYTEKGDTENSGTIRENSDPAVRILNQRGYTLTASKEWSDEALTSAHQAIYLAVFAGESYVEGSLRKLSSTKYPVKWFLESLESGLGIDDYSIREVVISGSENAPQSVSAVAEGGKINLLATAKDGSEGSFTYTVSYEKGSAKASAAGLGHCNVRTDKVVNTREGGVRLVKLDQDGNGLAGAVFTLTDSEGNFVGSESYTSAESGLITTAYLADGSYTLTETAAPAGYMGLAASVSISVENGAVSVSAAEDSQLVSCQPAVGGESRISIVNRSFTFRIRKVESGSGLVLAGAHFAVYRQVEGTSGLMKDYYPAEGLADLVSGEDGFAAAELEKLPAGTYYITETAAPAGYEKLAEDICLTVSANGRISLNSFDARVRLQFDEASCAYVLSVDNAAVIEEPPVAPTGVSLSVEPYVMMAVLGVLVAALVLLKRRGREEE